MALISCRECVGDISTEAKSCPKCGAPVLRSSRIKWWFWVPLGLVVAFFGFGAVVGNSPEGQERSKMRRAIDACWDEQKRKSLDPGAQQFIAGVCEKMVSDFQGRYGVRP